MIERYLDEIGREPLLVGEEEKLLARRVQCGDAKARDRMIKANLRLVVKIAADFSDRGVPLVDLVSEGNVGLIKAVDRYRADNGAKFSTYASWWIREALQKCICAQSRAVRLPPQVLSKIGKLRRASAALSMDLGREPEPSEVADELGLSVDSVVRWEAIARTSASLDERIGGGEGFSLGATLRDEAAPSPGQGIFDAEICGQISGLLDVLDAREKRIIERRYGLGAAEACTLDEVRTEFGCTRERVRQIQDRALRKMRREWRRREAFAQLDRPAA